MHKFAVKIGWNRYIMTHFTLEVSENVLSQGFWPWVGWVTWNDIIFFNTPVDSLTDETQWMLREILYLIVNIQLAVFIFGIIRAKIVIFSMKNGLQMDYWPKQDL